MFWFEFQVIKDCFFCIKKIFAALMHAVNAMDEMDSFVDAFWENISANSRTIYQKLILLPDYMPSKYKENPEKMILKCLILIE